MLVQAVGAWITEALEVAIYSSRDREVLIPQITLRKASNRRVHGQGCYVGERGRSISNVRPGHRLPRDMGFVLSNFLLGEWRSVDSSLQFLWLASVDVGGDSLHGWEEELLMDVHQIPCVSEFRASRRRDFWRL